MEAKVQEFFVSLKNPGVPSPDSVRAKTIREKTLRPGSPLRSTNRIVSKNIESVFKTRFVDPASIPDAETKRKTEVRSVQLDFG
uniref:Uncharacterized protein n=1 Tax=Leptospira ellisii TaxID=2023197 RepID=A0A2N0B9T7_9LEPT|nr:hypothetical protein CH379_08495 [Leptospira ellisii]